MRGGLRQFGRRRDRPSLRPRYPQAAPRRSCEHGRQAPACARSAHENPARRARAAWSCAIAVTVPLRLVRCSSAISPKNVPSASRTRWFGSSISTSPAVMKYIEDAASPRRTRISPCSMVRARNSRMMSAISVALRVREQRHPRQHAPGHDEIAPPHLVGKGGRDDRDRQRDHRKAAMMAKTETTLPSGVTGTTSP